MVSVNFYKPWQRSCNCPASEQQVGYRFGDGLMNWRLTYLRHLFREMMVEIDAISTAWTTCVQALSHIVPDPVYLLRESDPSPNRNLDKTLSTSHSSHKQRAWTCVNLQNPAKKLKSIWPLDIETLISLSGKYSCVSIYQFNNAGTWFL